MCDLKSLQQGHGLPWTINVRVILYFHKTPHMKCFMNLKSMKKSQIYSIEGAQIVIETKMCQCDNDTLALGLLYERKCILEIIRR